MKKAFISAAAFAVVAASSIAVAPTTSEAIPAFARQTGAACLSCHFQTFPALSSFGRAFKLGALTDVGDQALVEDDNLSLPSVLNLGMVLRPAYTHVKHTPTGGKTTNMTTWAMPTDSNILVAGRVGTNVGAFVEFNGGAGNFQMFSSFDFGSFKGGLNAMATGFGPTAALELMSVYGQHGGKLWGSDVSAVQNVIPQSNTSVALWGSNGLITAQVAGVVAGAGVNNNVLVGPGTTSLAGASAANGNGAITGNNSFVPMIAVTLDTELGGFNAMLEVATMNGTQTIGGTAGGGAAVGKNSVKASWLAAQIQGELGDMSLGVYADFATTKSGANANYATAGFDKKDGYSIRAEIEPIHQLMFGVGVGSQKTSATSGSLSQKVTVTHYAATYEIYQNMEVTLSQTNTTTGKTTGVAGATASSLTAGTAGSSNKATRIELEAVF